MKDRSLRDFVLMLIFALCCYPGLPVFLMWVSPQPADAESFGRQPLYQISCAEQARSRYPHSVVCGRVHVQSGDVTFFTYPQ